MALLQMKTYIGLYVICLIYQTWVNAAPTDFLKAKQLLQRQQLDGMVPDIQEASSTVPTCTTTEADDGHSGHTMQMWFHSSVHATILFEGWHTMTWEELFGSCIIVCIMAALYEGFKVLRRYLYNKNFGSNDDDNKMTVSEGESTKWWSGMCKCSHAIQTMLQIVQVWCSMCLMLIFMTYNVWLCLAVSLGSALGYFLFAWKSNILEAEVCCG